MLLQNIRNESTGSLRSLLLGQVHISLVAMSLPPLAMSESKAAVLQRLGLTGEYGERIYKMLLVRFNLYEPGTGAYLLSRAGRGLSWKRSTEPRPRESPTALPAKPHDQAALQMG